ERPRPGRPLRRGRGRARPDRRDSWRRGAGRHRPPVPPDDPQWKSAHSLDLLNKAFLKVVEAGFQFVHADVTVILETPKLAPHIDAMEEKLAEALLTGPAHVSVKAKTNEGMGWIGRGEGIAVMAVATLAEPAGP